jgi:hypothetical protein
MVKGGGVGSDVKEVPGDSMIESARFQESLDRPLRQPAVDSSQSMRLSKRKYPHSSKHGTVHTSNAMATQSL